VAAVVIAASLTCPDAVRAGRDAADGLDAQARHLV
jgi:hypothetical protein